MTLTVATGVWDARFIECAATLRAGRVESHLPSRRYTELILKLAQTRPSEAILVRSGDTVVARAVVSAALGKPGSAAMGLIEIGATDATAATKALLDAASAWARAQGFQELVAPMDVNTWFNYRFVLSRVSGPVPPALFAWEPAQPAEYVSLLEQQGFEELQRFQTMGSELTKAEGLDAKAAVAKTEAALAAAENAGFAFQQVESAAQLGATLDELHPLCMAAFTENLLFEPLPLDLFKALFTEMTASKDCSLTHWIRDGKKRLVGFVLTIVEGEYVVIKTVAVAPELRGRRLSSALIHMVFRSAVKRGLKHFISALVRRGNTSEHLSSPYLRAGITPWRREYTLLRRSVT